MKILIISMAGIGDTLLATPFIHEIRLQYPEAEIDALVLWAGSSDLLEGNPHLNRVFQKNFFTASKLEILSFLRQLRRRKYDLSLNTHPQSRVHYRVISWMVGARRRLTHAYDCSGWLDRCLATVSVPQRYDIHGVENNFLLLDLLGRKRILKEVPLEIYISAPNVDWADKFFASHQLAGRETVGFHVGSGGTKNLPLKRWPLARHIELMRLLLKRHENVNILLFGGPQEQADHKLIVATLNDPRVLIVDSRSLMQTAAAMRLCRAFVSVDTALMHLGAAVCVPNQIVVEAPTLNATNMPYRPDFTVARNPMVAGRNLDYYRYDGRDIQGTREHLIECMNSIQAEDVYGVLRERLH